MKNALVILALACAAITCVAQIHPTPRVFQKVQDPATVINDRGSQLEVLANQRAIVTPAKTGGRGYQISRQDASASLGPKQLGVVFNHAMQVQGYITGEIAFKFKRDQEPTGDFDTDTYPGFAKLTKPNVYVVVARSPREFIDLVKRLQRRNDLEWVEPIVQYGEIIGENSKQ